MASLLLSSYMKLNANRINVTLMSAGKLKWTLNIWNNCETTKGKAAIASKTYALGQAKPC